MSVRLFREGSDFAIQTDATDEREFIEEFSSVLSEHAEEYEKPDLRNLLQKWLPQFTDICAAYRGYKTEVTRRTVFTAGDRMVSDPVHEFNTEIATQP